jgi:arylsulfatase A-like enzyme
MDRVMSQNHASRGRRAAVAAGLAFLACAFAVSHSAPAGAAPNSPNVVVVLTDDMTLRDLYESKGNGKGKKLMPRTRALLGKGGVTFDRYYSSNSISCPSRTTNLTGQYSKNHGVTRNTFGKGKYCSDPGRVDFNRTLPAWLQDAGYRTIHYGRFLNAFGLGRNDRVPEGWDHYVQPVETNVSSTAVFYGYRLNVNGVVGPKFGNTKKPDKKNYFTDVMVNMALDTIADGPLSQPFYLALDHRAPHEDSPLPVGPQPALRHNKALKGKKPRKPPSYDEKDVSDKTKWLRQSNRLRGRQKKLITTRNKRRLASLLAVDEGVSKMVKRLQALGELNNTYIFFTSDNGFFNGEHRISKGKYRPYESSSHMPLMMRGPGVPKGRVSKELVMNVDLAPTIVDIADATPNRVMDGRSLLPFARNPKKSTRRPLLLEAYPPKPGTAATASPVAQALSSAGGPLAFTAKDPTPPNWKAIVYGRYKLAQFKGQGYELYDLKRDPDEINSVAKRPRYRAVFGFLRKNLKRLAKCRGASCRRTIGKLPKAGGGK